MRFYVVISGTLRISLIDILTDRFQKADDSFRGFFCDKNFELRSFYRSSNPRRTLKVRRDFAETIAVVEEVFLKDKFFELKIMATEFVTVKRRELFCKDLKRETEIMHVKDFV